MESALLDMAVKGTIVLALTGAVAASMRSRSAAMRHLVWSTGTAAVVALPALAMLLPRWSVAMMPVRSASAIEGAPAVVGVMAGSPQVWVILWAVGTVLVLAVFVIGRLRVRLLARDALRMEYGPWFALATRLAGEMGVAHGVRLLLSRHSVMPMMWGVFRPTILLPREADGWSEALKRDVILHELAHVQRHDYLSQMVAWLACALYWFNPLAWFAARRLRLERERACDDRVIEAGSSPCDYATHLLAVTCWRATGFVGTPALGMAGASALADRLRAILEAGRSRHRVSRRLAIGHGALTALLIVPLAVLHPVSPPAPAPVADDPGGVLPLPPSVTAPRQRASGPLAKPAATAAEPAPVARPAPTLKSPQKSSPAATPTPAAISTPAATPTSVVTPGRPGMAIAIVADARMLSRVNLVMKAQPESCPESKDHEADDIHDVRTSRTKLVSVPRPVLTP
ncbi:MAG: M56 family metallopeptidase [Gemmatimonadota bacterium]